MAAAICSPSLECDGGKADYTNERVIFFFPLSLSSVGGAAEEEMRRKEGGRGAGGGRIFKV